MNKIFFLFALFLNTVPTSSYGASDSRKWMISVGIFRAPLPSVYSVTAQYFLKPAVALGLGVGIGAKDVTNPLTVFGLSLALYPVPRWKVAPVARLIAQYGTGALTPTYTINGNSPLATYQLRNINNGLGFAADFGLEWKFKGDYRMGAGYGILLPPASGGLPYFQIGRAF
jgi:hypothetical protein